MSSMMVKRGPQLVQLVNGIVVAPVFGVEDFFEAGLACGDIRRHQLILAFFSNAVPNLELCIVCWGVIGNGDVFYMSQRRRIVLKLRHEMFQVTAIPLNFNLYVFRSIAHPAFQVVLGS